MPSPRAVDLSYALKPFPQVQFDIPAPSMTPVSGLAGAPPVAPPPMLGAPYVPPVAAQPLPTRIPGLTMNPAPPSGGLQFGPYASSLPAPPASAASPLSQFRANIRGLGAKGWAKKGGGALVGAGAGVLAQNFRQGILSGGDRVLTNDNAPSRFFQSLTGGAVAGTPGGFATAIPAALGAGLGQASVDTLNAAADNSSIRDFADSYQDERNPFMYIGKRELSGALNTFGGMTGDELSVGNAIGKIPSYLQGGEGAPELMPRIVNAAIGAGNKQIAETLKPESVVGAARAAGVSEQTASMLGKEWEQNVATMTAQAKAGQLRWPGKTGEDGKVQEGPVVTEAELPRYLSTQLQQMTANLPAMVEEERAAAQRTQEAQLAQEAQMKAQADAQRATLADAFGYSLALNGLIQPHLASFSQNPYTAPYAGLLQQGYLQLPYQLAAEQQAAQQKQAEADLRAALNQQSRAPLTPEQEYQIAYQKALGAARGKLEGGGDQGTDPLAGL